MIKVIKNGTVITMNNLKEIKKCDIVIENDKIIDIVTDYTGSYDVLIDAKDKIVMPGLINTHTHLGMSIFRNTNDGLDLMSWLNNKIWPIEDKMTDQDIEIANMLSCAEAIKTGSTTVNDMYFGVNALEGIEKSKIRCVYTRTLIGDINEKVEEFENLILKNDNDLITYTVSPHSLYTCSKELLTCVYNLSAKYNLPIHIHFCENEEEVKQIKEKFNMDPIDVLEHFGFLNRHLILAHCVYLDNFKKLAKDNVHISHNIVSNLNLGCGIAPINKYLENNLNLALGTDGNGSALTLDMFNTMSFTSLVLKGNSKNPLIDSYSILEMATINGAKALGLDDKVGSIEKNKKADIIILDINNIESFPINNLINHIVHNIKPNNVITSIINGEIVMKDRKLLSINEDELRDNVNKLINKLNLKEDTHE